MKSLAELESAKLAGLRGLVFDIDDTLTRDGRLEAVAFNALWKLRDAGLHLIAITGRPLGWADVVARHWPVDAAVGENGAGWIWREGERYLEGYFEDAATREANAQVLQRIRDQVRHQLPNIPVSADDRARRCDLAFDIGESYRASPQEVEALVALIERAGLISSVSSVHCHAATGDWDKAKGAALAIRDALGVDLVATRDQWLFIGDSGNDAAAFAAFELSVGVANVREHLERLPVPPAYVTRADRGQGFAELADRVLEARA